MRRTVLALAALILSPAAAPAQCYRPSYSYGYSNYSYPTVIKEIIKEVAYVATPVLVPVYSTGYVAPAAVAPAVPAVTATAAVAPAAAATTSYKEDRLVALLEKLDARMTALEARVGGQDVPAPVPVPAAASVNGLSILRTHCASCHTEGKLYTGPGKTTNFVLFKADGAPNFLKSEQIRKVGKMVRQGTMPLDRNTLRPVTISNDEYTVLQDYLDAMKASN